MEQKIKVLQYFWGSLNSGGAETMIVNLFKKINRQNFSFDFLVYEDKEYFYNSTIRELNGSIISLTNRESRFLPLRLIKRWRNLYNVMKKNQYDVFHCNCDFSFKFVEMMIAKKAAIPKRVCHSHNSSIDTTTIKGKLMWIAHIICRKLLVHYSTEYLACSKQAAIWLYGNNEISKSAIIINNGVDSSYFAINYDIRNKLREELGVRGDFVIGNVGRFTAIKNQKFIIDILEYMIKDNKHVKLILVGDGELKDELICYSKEKKLENHIIFAGMTNKVRDYLFVMDAFVMPSLYEGLPVSGIEAQATGLTCVVSDAITKGMNLTGLVEYVSLKESTEKWGEIILHAYQNNIRKNMHETLVKKGYDIVAVAKKLELIYHK